VSRTTAAARERPPRHTGRVRRMGARLAVGCAPAQRPG
jgi:hypothetical protein